MNLTLVVPVYDNKPIKRIKLDDYFLYDLGENSIINSEPNLKFIKKRIHTCYDIRSALEKNGYDAFKMIKENLGLVLEITYKEEIYEIRNLKIKEYSLINTLIDVIMNLFIH